MRQVLRVWDVVLLAECSVSGVERSFGLAQPFLGQLLPNQSPPCMGCEPKLTTPCDMKCVVRSVMARGSAPLDREIALLTWGHKFRGGNDLKGVRKADIECRSTVRQHVSIPSDSSASSENSITYPMMRMMYALIRNVPMNRMQMSGNTK